MMTGKHWGALALFLGGTAISVSSLHSWAEAASPAFVGGLFAQASGAILALFSDKPGDPK